MKYNELKRKLLKAGCFPLHSGSRHEKWYNPKTGKYSVIGRHGTQEVPKGLLNRIYEQLGL